MAPRNLLFLTTGQHRWDCLSCYGNPHVCTPHLDRLAARGLTLDRAYCQTPASTPSRLTLLTGKTATHHGVTLHGSSIRSDERTLAHELTDAGYLTACFGSLHLYSQHHRGTPESILDWRDGLYHGFTGPIAGFSRADLVLGQGNPLVGHFGEFLKRYHREHLPLFWRENMECLSPPDMLEIFRARVPPDLHSATYIAGRTADFLQNAADSGRPFFCWTAFPDPNWPLVPPQSYLDRFADTPVAAPTPLPHDLTQYPRHFRDLPTQHVPYDGAARLIPDQDYLNLATRAYYATISFLDSRIGHILDALDTLGLRDNTIVVFTAHHGEYMGDHGLVGKGGFPWESLLRVPLLISAPGALPEGARTTALFSFPDFIPSLEGLLERSLPLAHDGVDQMPTWTGRTETVRTAVTCHLPAHSPGRVRYPDIHTLITDRWKLSYYAGDPHAELYDLHNDPAETRNLYALPAHAEVRDRMIRRLLDTLILTPSRQAHLARTKGGMARYADPIIQRSVWGREMQMLDPLPEA